jgi:hypothetical protein
VDGAADGPVGRLGPRLAARGFPVSGQGRGGFAVRPAGSCPARWGREEVVRYLEAAGWRRQEPVTWQGVGWWSQPGDEDEREVLVPLAPGFRDEARRLREAVRTLAEVEGRPASEVARDIAPHRWGDDPGDGADVVAYSADFDYGLSVDVGRCGGCGAVLAAVGPHGSERFDERRALFEVAGAELAGEEGSR